MALNVGIKPNIMHRNAAQLPGSKLSWRRNLQICRVTNTSEEIYKNLGLEVPTGNEELEEVRLAILFLPESHMSAKATTMHACRFPFTKRKSCIPSSGAWSQELASSI